MKKRIISLAVIAAMLLSSFLMLASCNDDGELDTTGPIPNETTEDPSDEPTEEPSDESAEEPSGESTEKPSGESTEEPSGESTEEPSGESTEAPGTDTTEATDPTDEIVYENGDKVDNAGHTFAQGSFADTAHAPAESDAEKISAADLEALLAKNDLSIAGKTYLVEDALALKPGVEYFGHGAAIIAKAGVVIDQVHSSSVTNLIIKGDVRVTASTELTLKKTEIQGALTLDGECNDINFTDCRVISDKTAVSSAAEALTFYSCYISADNAIASAGSSLTVQNCNIEAKTSGVTSSGEYCIVRGNTISCDADGVAVELTQGSVNALVALNEIKDSQFSIKVSNGFNCVVLLNSAIRVIGENSTNLYVVENKLGGCIKLTSNKYLLCDGNTFKADNNSHPISSIENTEINGDNITDISARAEYGVNEDILPHTNKDLFIGMERQRYVSDASLVTSTALNNYIRDMAAVGDVVIVPPGAYANLSHVALTTDHSNTSIYAYGVYAEATYLNRIVDMQQSENVDVKGLTMGYTHASAGQLHVIKKVSLNEIIVVPSAGFGYTFRSSDYKLGAADIFHEDEKYPWCDFSHKFTLKDNKDGTYTLAITASNARDLYKELKVNDVLVCRLAGDNMRSINLDGVSNVSFKDCVLYGYSAALAVVSQNGSREVTFERFHNTAHSAYEIEKDEYDEYKALEEEFSTKYTKVDLGMYIDEAGRYRGGLPLVGSVDAIHAIRAAEGTDLISSILESMCDDGSNQRASGGRLAGIKDNGDGTYTVYFKGSAALGKLSSSNKLGTVAIPAIGDRLSAYAPNGEIVFRNAEAISDAKLVLGSTEHWVHTDNNGDGVCDKCSIPAYTSAEGVTPAKDAKYDPTSGKITFKIDTQQYETELYSVKIKGDVNLSAVEGIDFASNDYSSENKVHFDNISRNSNAFTFDNVLIQNTRSRGMLIKSTDTVIKNCTFRNLARTGILISRELEWGESTTPYNLLIQDCLFDNTGANYGSEKSPLQTHIAILGTGELGSDIVLSESTLPCSDIQIIGNKFVNTNNNNALYISGAQNVTIKDNIIEERSKNNGKIAEIDGCLNIEISGNTFSDKAMTDLSSKIIGYNYKNLHGSDVDGVIAAENLEKKQ